MHHSNFGALCRLGVKKYALPHRNISARFTSISRHYAREQSSACWSFV
jgi:hypothetical protein